MVSLHTQSSVSCLNVQVDSESRIMNLTGNSSDSLVERGAVVQGGSLVNATVSGKIVLINCTCENTIITGVGFRQNEKLTGRVKLVHIPKKRPEKFRQIGMLEYEGEAALPDYR